MSAIDDIRARHARQESVNAAWSPNQIPQAHHDRGALLRVVDDQAAEIESLKQALEYEHKSWSAGSVKIRDQAAKITRLREALEKVHKDGHRYGTRLCPTCREVSTVVGYDFGCVAYRNLRAAALHPVEANQEEAQHG